MKKLLALILCAVLALSVLSSCTKTPADTKEDTKKEETKKEETKKDDAKKDETEKAETEAAADPDNPWAGIMDYSKQATITYTVFGNKPNDMDEVLELINARLLKLVNTKLEMNFISLADWVTKYPLALADDSNDMIYAASWNKYATNASSGAFLELTEDFRSKYMPESMKVMTPAAWKQCSIDGKIYAVPRNQHDNNNYGAFIFREDILEKTGYKDGVHNYEEFFDFVEKAAEVMDPSEGYAFYAFPSMPMVMPFEQLKDHVMGVYNNMVWFTDEELKSDASNLYYYYLTDSYKEYVLRMADWAKKGVWPSTAIDSSTHTEDQFTNGRCAFYQARYTEAGNIIKSIEEKGYKVVYLPIIDDKTYVRLTDYSGDMTAITSMSKQPERAAVVLDILKNDIEINMLCQGGVEGRHYILNDDGTRSAGPEADDYGWSAWAWSLRDMNHYPTEKMDPRVEAVLEELNKHVLPEEKWPFDGFVTNDEAYPTMSAELAVVQSLITEYQYSFDLGVFGDDTEAKYEEFCQKLKDAGIENLIAEWRKQAAAYMAQ
ncbi:MAG: DUF3502 domain-containing protein [Lachnospiraceae bacterium]|nr:DUF3502 domain-containing protein [Lachnospiraceae bacterium]